MSKKNRRAVVPQETLARARAEMRGEIQTSTTTDAEGNEKPKAGSRTSGAVVVRPTSRPGQTPLAVRRTATIEELTRQYAYVNRDLRNLVTLAVGLMALIVVASLVLTRLG